MRRWKRLGLLAAIAACAAVASGCPQRPRIVYDQSDYGTSLMYSELRMVSHTGHPSHVADEFTLTARRSTITRVRWWGAYRGDVPAVDDFTFRIHADAGDGPEPDFRFEHHAGHVTREPTGDIVYIGGDPQELFQYSCNVPATALEPGTRHFLVILNDTGNWLWSLNSSEDQGNDVCYVRQTASGDWVALWHYDAAFQLWTNRR